MRPLIFKTQIDTNKNKSAQNTYHRSLIIFLLCGIFLFMAQNAYAEENATSTPEITGETATSTSDSTSEIIEEPITPTTTPEISNETSTTTADVIVPTSTLSEIIFATTTINLRIITFDQKLYSNEFVVTACQPNANSSSTTLTPYCALQQAAEQNNWNILFNDYGGAKFLSKINQYDGADWNWWAFFHNLDFASEALNQYELQPHDEILLAYGIFPLKLEISTTTPALNTTTTLTAKQFGFDSAWAPGWSEAASSTIIINNLGSENPSGAFELFVNTSTPYKVYAVKNNFIDSKKQIIIPQEEKENTETDSGNNNGSGSNQTTPTNTPLSQDAIKTAADKILNYLKSQQDETGKIMDANISDWALMAFAANKQYAHDIKNNGQSLFTYALNYDFSDPSDLNVCATYPRHILALLSAGVEKNSAKLQELKTKIKTECYKNNVFGLSGINDDIFGLFSLLALNENPSEPIVSTTINAILSDQQADGSFTWAGWPGVDITGAAINALRYTQNRGLAINDEIFSKAKNYLKSQQLADGGFGYGASDILTTSWAVMGINALGEGQSEWFNSTGKNPWHPLVNLINTAGYYESAWATGATDWFATKHAVPALLGKSWPIILPARQEETNIANNSSGGGVYIPPMTTTTSLITETPTSTVTSTIQTPNSDLSADEADNPTPTSTATSTIEFTTTTLDTETSTISTVQTPNSNNQTPNDINQNTNNRTQTPNHSITSSLNNNITVPSTNTEYETKNTDNTTISSFSTSTPPTSSRTAKTVFGISLTMASGLGLYLVWRLIQTVV